MLPYHNPFRLIYSSFQAFFFSLFDQLSCLYPASSSSVNVNIVFWCIFKRHSIRCNKRMLWPITLCDGSQLCWLCYIALRYYMYLLLYYFYIMQYFVLLHIVFFQLSCVQLFWIIFNYVTSCQVMLLYVIYIDVLPGCTVLIISMGHQSTCQVKEGLIKYNVPKLSSHCEDDLLVFVCQLELRWPMVMVERGGGASKGFLSLFLSLYL